MSDLVGTPDDRFSCVVAHIVSTGHRKHCKCIVTSGKIQPTANVISKHLILKSHLKDLSKDLNTGLQNGRFYKGAAKASYKNITYELCHEKTRFLPMRKSKAQISFAVTVKLISAFIFATQIVQFLFFLISKFRTSSHLLCLYSSVCVRPDRKPRRPVFSCQGSYNRYSGSLIK